LKRTLLIVAMAAVLVAAIAVSVALLSRGGSQGPPAAETQAGASGSASTSLGVAPAPSLQEPSEETWNELLPQLEAAVQSAPGDVNLQRKLALAYYNLSRFDEAEAIYRHLLAAQEDAVLRDRLGNTLRDKGDPVGAESAYRQAITDDPTLPSPYVNLAELLWRQGRDPEALQVLDDGLAAVPEDGRATLDDARSVIEGSGQ
jgi:tetratricopeptide (TPR) repeat protein